MNHVIPIASGKGGVGKTLVAANVGIALAQQNKTVVLVDLDLGGSNLHTVLGIRNRHPGIGHFIHGQAESLESLIIRTRQDRLFFVAGDGLFAGTANMPYWKKIAIGKQLATLPADYVLLDLGSGTAYNTLDLYLTSSLGLIVTTPDTTAILNAYLFLKSAMLRLLQRSFPGRSAERAAIDEFMHEKVEGADLSMATLAGLLDEVSPDAARTARAALDSFRPRIVMNMGRMPSDIQLGTRLRTIARNNLDCDVAFLAYLPHDELAMRSAIDRSPTLLAHPRCPFSAAVHDLARKLVDQPMPEPAHLYAEDQDLSELEQEFIGRRGTP